MVNQLLVKSFSSVKLGHYKETITIPSILEFPIGLIDFLLPFSQAVIDMYVFVDLPLGMGVDGNRETWVLKLNKSLFGIKQASKNWFDFLNNGVEI